jgi:hypothetical protein
MFLRSIGIDWQTQLRRAWARALKRPDGPAPNAGDHRQATSPQKHFGGVLSTPPK